MAGRKGPVPKGASKQAFRVMKPLPTQPSRRSERLKKQQQQEHVPTKASIPRHAPLPSPDSESYRETRKRKEPEPPEHIPIKRPKKRIREDTEPKAYTKKGTLKPITEHQASSGNRNLKPVAKPEAKLENGGLEPVTHWVLHDRWPVKLPNQKIMSGDDSKKRSRSRSHSTTSYTQGYRDGIYPRPHSRQHERAMADRGMIMDQLQDEARIDQESHALCQTLLEAIYDPPTDSLFLENNFMRRAQSRNEARIRRDLTPSLVPSAETLYILNGQESLQHVLDEVDQDWNKCDPIFGPMSRPDYAAGLAKTAFTASQLEQVEKNHTSKCPSNVTDDMYFPFLIVELKSSDKPIDEAERQAMQSASIAVNAIVELYRKVSRAEELDQKILAFSISHNHRDIRIYGHYARTIGNTRYFRHLLRSYDFTDPRERWTAYYLTRKLYDHFIPVHLNRIYSALTDLENLQDESDSEDSDVQEIATSAQPSQDQGSFKKPSLPSTNMLQRENDKLHEQMSVLVRQIDQMRQDHKEQMDQLRQDHKEQTDRLMSLFQGRSN